MPASWRGQGAPLKYVGQGRAGLRARCKLDHIAAPPAVKGHLDKQTSATWQALHEWIVAFTPIVGAPRTGS